MLRRIKKVVNERLHIDEIFRQSKEIEWAHIYHDSIRGRKWLEELAIHPGRWAVNYSLLYILVRIMGDCKPDTIIEFGLGESSKVISRFVENELTGSRHIIIEHNEEWAKSFSSRFTLSGNSTILHLELENKNINNFIVNSYKGLANSITEAFNLYVIDGPLGSERYSRYDICLLANEFSITDEFIIVMDDYDRLGEQETAGKLVDIFTNKGINTFSGVYTGRKTQLVVATSKYRNVISL